MLKFRFQSLFEFSTYVDILLIDDVPFCATWKTPDTYKEITFRDRILTTITPEGRRSILITDNFIKRLRFLYKCVLNPSKSLLLPDI